MKKSFYFCIYLNLVILLTGCQREHITAQTSYWNRSQLASYHVETPDPRLNYPMMGQRLLVSWALPQSYFAYSDLHLEITIRFGDRSELVKNILLCDRAGEYLYSLIDEEYFNKEGILTYKIDVVGDGVILERWRHQLWVELISVGGDEEGVDEGNNEENVDVFLDKGT